MAANLPTDKVDPLTEITTNMTKYIRHLEAQVQKIKKLPTAEEIWIDVKNNIWKMMCKRCRSIVYLSSEDLSSGNKCPSKQHCNEAKVKDIGKSKSIEKQNLSDMEKSVDESTEKEHIPAKIESVSHPLQQDKEEIEDLKNQVSTLLKCIKEKNQNITSLESQLQKETKRYAKNTKDKGKYQYEAKQRQTPEDQTSSLARTNEALTSTIDGLQQNIVEKQSELDKVQKDNERYIADISQLQAEKQTLQDQISSLNSTKEELGRTNDKLDRTIEEMDRTNKELTRTKEELVRTNEENATSNTEMARTREELNQTNEELTRVKEEMASTKEELDRAKDEMTSATEALQRDIDRLKEELEKNHGDFNTVQKEKEEYLEQFSQLQTERKTLEDKNNSLIRTNKELSSTVEDLQRDIEKKQDDFDRNRQEKQTLEDQTISLNKKNEELSSRLKIQQQNLEKMTGDLEGKDSELGNAIKENERYIADISQLQTEKQTLQDKISSLNRTNEEMVSVTEGLQRDIDRLTRELEKNRGDFDTIRTEKDELLEQLSQLQTEKQTLENQKNSLTRTNEELSSTEEGLQQHIDRLTAELEKKQSDFDQSQKEKEEYVEEISQLQTEIQTVQATLKTGQQNIEEMTGELVKKDEEIANLKAALEECRRLKKKVVVMRLLRSSRSGLGKAMVEMVNKELKRHLGERLDSKNFDFSVVLSESPADVSNGPLFVLCLNMSRVGTNIQDALEGTKGGRDVYVLVLHHTNKENLSTLTPTRLRVTGSELRQLGGIFDLAFSSNSGLYECDLNITTIDKIATVLKKV